MSLGLTKISPKSFKETTAIVTEALKKEGFGIITQIDVTATMMEKLGLEFSPYVILGACNPPLAHQALLENPEIGLFLPCNVIVYVNANEQTVVSFFNPELMSKIMDNENMKTIAREVRKKIQNAFDAIEGL